MKVNELTIGIVGSGGDGSIACGEILTRAAAKVGLNAFFVKSFGPQIRGGESSARIRLGTHDIFSQGDRLDVLVVFEWSEFKKFYEELLPKTGVIVLHDESKDPESAANCPLGSDAEPRLIDVPFTRLAEESAGNAIAKNMVMLGALAELFHLPFDEISDVVAHRFKKKGEQVISANQSAVESGRVYAQSLNLDYDLPRLDFSPRPPRMVLTGNDAVSCGAVSAGCRFFAGYPITPSSEVMEWLTRELPRLGGAAVQTEDEISAMNMVVGSGYAGGKAMTATSGPGLSLKQEAIGLASMAEVPCVILDVQRCGPSTGIPTKSEQSDLMAALYGSHGDSAKIILAPTSVSDCFDVTRKAFAVAEAFQTPVIILSDQFIGQRMETVEPFDPDLPEVEWRKLAQVGDGAEFHRYAFTDDCVSPTVIAGTPGGEHLVAGIEHTVDGRPTSSHTLHQEMNEKRYKKLEGAIERFGLVHRFGPDDAEYGLIGWGSSRGALQEAVARMESFGIRAAGMVPEMIYPLPLEDVESFMKGKKAVMAVELTYHGQFFRYLKSSLNDSSNLVSYARSGANPLLAEEIVSELQRIASA